MTSERPRFPVGLTLAAVLVFTVCCALGVWQLQRAQWKAHELAQIEARRNAPPAPINPVLRRAAAGADVTFQRVAATCSPAPAAVADTRMITDNGDWIARAMSFCDLSGSAYKAIFVDRGLVEASRGSTTAPRVVLPAPASVVGVLSHVRGDCFGSDGCSYRFGNLGQIAPYVLVAESETPPAPGVKPAPYPDAAGNLEYVGSYAPTWFGLAGVLVCFYAAMLWRRYHPKP
jgi:surfeit locus 1 family protein